MLSFHFEYQKDLSCPITRYMQTWVYLLFQTAEVLFNGSVGLLSLNIYPGKDRTLQIFTCLRLVLFSSPFRWSPYLDDFFIKSAPPTLDNLNSCTSHFSLGLSDVRKTWRILDEIEHFPSSSSSLPFLSALVSGKHTLNVCLILMFLFWPTKFDGCNQYLIHFYVNRFALATHMNPAVLFLEY